MPKATTAPEPVRQASEAWERFVQTGYPPNEAVMQRGGSAFNLLRFYDALSERLSK